MYVLADDVLNLLDFHIHYAARNDCLKVLILKGKPQDIVYDARKFRLQELAADGITGDRMKVPHVSISVSSFKNLRKFCSAFLDACKKSSSPIICLHAGHDGEVGMITETQLLGHNIFQDWYWSLCVQCDEIRRLDTVRGVIDV